MANYLIKPYAKNIQGPSPGSPMLGLRVGPTLHFYFTIVPVSSISWHILFSVTKAMEDFLFLYLSTRALQSHHQIQLTTHQIPIVPRHLVELKAIGNIFL
ncbi:hypothetical protein PoB_003168600 [Plakobranchus ocellatus]|uniref:Uncharacterized protein n=1 Tax=Plakobranchus ocellatus TaxID=259542 RepID=A0AAV4AA30_9GAST|nr:hypothetical protein PoB_003168600 [Plakobranchus ocellatus]